MADSPRSSTTVVRRALRGPWAAAGIYLLLGGVWIAGSDTLVAQLARTADELNTWQTWKGWAYVALTGILAWILVRRAHLGAQRLAEAEAERDNLAALAESSSDLLTIVSPDGHYMAANPAYAATFGLTPAQIVGRTVAAVAGPEVWKEAQAHLVETARGVRQRYTATRRDATGAVRTYDVTQQPVGPIDASRGILVSLRDITDKARDAALLQEHRDRMARSQRLMQVGHWRYDVLNKRFESSPELGLLCGLPAGHALDVGWFEAHTHPEDRAAGRAHLGDWIQQGVGGEFALRVVLDSGESRHWLGVTDVERGANGEVTALVGALQDVTERVRLAEQVQQSGELYRAIVDQAEVAIALIDPDSGRFVEANRYASAYLGCAPDALTSLCLQDIEANLSREEILVLLHRLREAPQAAFDSRHRRRDGDLRHVRMGMAPVHRGGQQLICAVWSDLTELRRIEAALRQSEAALHIAQRVARIGSFAYQTQGRKLIASPEAVRLFGLPPGTTPSLEMAWARVAEDTRDAVRGALQRLLAGETVSVEFRVAMADGARWLRAIVEPRPGLDDNAGLIGTVQDIDDSRHSEDALRASEARLRRAIEEAPFPIMIHAEDGQVLSLNRAWRDGCGYGPEQLRTLVDWTDLAFGPEGNAMLARLTGRYAVNERHAEGEFTIRCADGSERRWELHTAPLERMPDGRRAVMSIASDVTERHRAQLRALEGAESAQRIVDTAPDAMFVVDGNGRIARANARAHTLFGCEAGQLAGLPIETLLPEALREGHVRRRRAYFANPEARPMSLSGAPLRARRRDGSEFPVEISLAPVRLGGVTHVIATVLDVTAKLAAESEQAARQERLEVAVAQRTAELRDREQLIRAVFDAVDEGIVVIDPDTGVVADANLAAARLFAQERALLLGATLPQLLEAVRPGDEAEIQRRVRDAFAGERGSFDWAIAEPDGSRRWLGIDSLRCVLGGLPRLLVVVRDETAHRRTVEAAERLARARSDFLANMSHEIRTPLNGLLGLAQLALRRSAEPATLALLRRMLDAGAVLRTVVNDVLDFAKVESGKLSFEHIPFQLADLVDRAVDLFGAQARAKGLTLQLDMAPDLPPTWEGDPVRLTQVLSNLLGNAIKFTERGQVALSLRHTDGQLEITVADSGVGIAPEHLARLFEPFEQGDSSITRRFGGTGLGLAISRRLVEGMGGTVQIDSRPGEGTRVRLRLPLPARGEPVTLGGRAVALLGFEATEHHALAQTLADHGAQVHAPETLPAGGVALAHGAALPPALQANLARLHEAGATVCLLNDRSDTAHPGMATAHVLVRPLRVHQLVAALSPAASPVAGPLSRGPRLGGLRVLAAEDTEVNRIVLEEALAEEGAVLTLAHDGAQALALLRERGTGAFDLILTDLHMPVMDGYALAAAARALDPTLPVIGVSADAMHEAQQACLAAGMVAHVAKPFDVDTLVTCMLAHVRAPRGKPPVPASAATPHGQPEPGNAMDMGPDWRALEARFAGKPAFVRRLIDTVVTTQGGTGAALRSAAAAGDTGQVASLAHSLRGVAGNLQAMGLHALAQSTEAAARAGQDDCFTRASELADAADAFTTALRNRAATDDDVTP